MNKSLAASVYGFSNGILVIRVFGDLDIDIELISRQNGASDVSVRQIPSGDSIPTNTKELDIAIDDPTSLLRLIHEYLNSIEYFLKDDVLGTRPPD